MSHPAAVVLDDIEDHDDDGIDAAELHQRLAVIIDPAATAFAIEAAAMALADTCLHVSPTPLLPMFMFSRSASRTLLHDTVRYCCLDLGCTAALIARIDSPSCAASGKDRARLMSRLANAAAVIASASDRGRAQLLQVNARSDFMCCRR